MVLPVISALMLAAAAPSAAPDAAHDAQQLRCSAAFSLLDFDQQRGIASALAYPPMRPDGVEYFIAVLADRMEREQLTEDQVKALVGGAVAQLQAETAGETVPGSAFAAVMADCLPRLKPAADDARSADRE